ncbi:predicted protein [Chaetoceros tenuissimus]|uniref:Uncharacterized protein n=1 Tax=Chaetoceros tenuissimus TaxID=426638 RepID=A0AAD3H281_9STRA|nr:predicted protein [Chaetoceros tenuissimus]
MTDEFKDDHGSTIEDGERAEVYAKQACALCLNEYKKSALTLFDLNNDQRESLLCSICLSKVNRKYKKPQASSPVTYDNNITCDLCQNEFIESALTLFEREYLCPTCHIALSIANGTNEFPQASGPVTYDNNITPGAMASHRNTPSYCKVLPIPICIGLLCFVFYIWVANDYFPTRKWESIVGTINSPCLVEYEIDGQLYTFESNFNCEKFGPYKLKYNPEDPSDAMSAGFQDQSRIMLLVSGCLASIFIVGIPFAMCATFLCRRFDIGPMLERTFKRS